jgi:cytochrome c oxidase cbb3-type subunit 4
MMGVFNGVMTAILTILFIGIWVWAWSSKNREKFNKMAQMPLEETATEEEVGDER